MVSAVGGAAIGLAVFTLCVLIVALALSAHDKRGFVSDDTGFFYQTGDITAGFGLVGECLGIIAMILLIVIGITEAWMSSRVTACVVLILLSLFFLGGGVALLGSLVPYANLFTWRILLAELAFEVISAFFLIVCAAYLISRLESRTTGAVEARKN